MNHRELNRKVYALQEGQWTRIEAFFLSFSLGFLLAFLCALMAPSRAMAGDIAGDASSANRQQVLNQNGMVSGKVTETANSVIIDGATFVSSGNDQPVVKVDADTRKKVILRNVKIISNNQTVSDLNDTHKGAAGIVAVDNSLSKSKVVMRNVRVVARNANVSSVSEERDGCAGLVCSKGGRYDQTQSVSTAAVGRTNISSVQGARPDYRKVAATNNMRYGTQRTAAAASASSVSPVTATQRARPDYRKLPQTN